MWRRLAKCFSCGKSGRRKRSGSSDKNNDEDAADKYTDSELNKDTGLEHDKANTTQPRLAPKEDEDLIKDEKEVDDENIGEEKRNIDQVENVDDGHASKTVTLNKGLVATVSNDFEEESKQVSGIQRVNNVCYSPERKDVVVSNSLEKVNNIECEEVVGVDAQTEHDLTSGASSVIETGASEDLAISNAVDDILGALDNILAKEKTASTEIKTINITQLCSKSDANESAPTQAVNHESSILSNNRPHDNLPKVTEKAEEKIITEPSGPIANETTCTENKGSSILSNKVDLPKVTENAEEKIKTEPSRPIASETTCTENQKSSILSNKVDLPKVTENAEEKIKTEPSRPIASETTHTENQETSILSNKVDLESVTTQSANQDITPSTDTIDNGRTDEITEDTANEKDTICSWPLTSGSVASQVGDQDIPSDDKVNNAKENTENTTGEVESVCDGEIASAATQAVNHESLIRSDNIIDNIHKKETAENTGIETTSIKSIVNVSVEARPINQDTPIPSIIVTEPIIEQEIALTDQEVPSNDNEGSCENPVNVDVPNEREIVEENSKPTQQSNKRHSLVLVEKFSEALSHSVIGAVIQKSDEDDHRSIITNAEVNYWRFSDILADSIVNTVLEYSNQIIDENSNFGINQESVDEQDTTTQDDTDIQTDNESCSMGELDDEELSLDDLNDYAKRLSEHIITNVLGDQHVGEKQNNGCENMSAEVYISRLTENIISKAITKANGCVNGQSKTTGELLDAMVTKLVQNVLQSAMTRMEDGTSNGSVHHGDGSDHCRVDSHQHGDSPDGFHGDFANGGTSSDGKLQSKWLSEDDLDELYESDISEEETTNTETTTMANNSAEQHENTEDMSFLRPHHDRLNQEERTKWRSSLIEDLDEELEFDEEDSVCEESISKKVVTIEAVSSDEEMKDDVETPLARVSNGPVKSTVTRHSRLRSVDSTPTLVFDNGSGFLKVGYSNDSVPREIIPSVVGMPLRYSQDISGIEYSSRPGLVFGEVALNKAGVLHNDYPLKPDLVEKWSDVEGLWGHVLNEVMSIAEHPECPILLTQPAVNAKKNTEKLAEIMFEKFHFPSMYIACQPALALYSMGYTTGVSFCSGFSRSQAAVVYEGHVLPHTVRQLDIAGFQLTETLKKLLMSVQGVGFRGSSQWKIVDDIKRKMAFVSSDFQADVKRYKNQEDLHEPYELPDGQVIDVGVERCGCAETLFRPAELGLSQLPAHMLIADAIQSCDEELQELCYKAAGISGGTTLLKGFPERLEQELRDTDRKFKNLIVPEHRELCTWLGGAVQASLSTFREMVVDVEEYAEVGVRVVHSKCF